MCDVCSANKNVFNCDKVSKAKLIPDISITLLKYGLLNSGWRAFCQDSCIVSASKESKIALVTTTAWDCELEAVSVGSRLLMNSIQDITVFISLKGELTRKHLLIWRQ